MNILFFIQPKASIVVLKDDYTLRQTLEVMEHYRYSTLPIVNESGEYVGTVSEGDLLWFIKDKVHFDLLDTEKIMLKEINRHRDYIPVHVTQSMEALVDVSVKENFVPIIDDRNKFIGIIRRQDIIKYFYEKVGAVYNEHLSKN